MELLKKKYIYFFYFNDSRDNSKHTPCNDIPLRAVFA